jgi:hypothetical protein
MMDRLVYRTYFRCKIASAAQAALYVSEPQISPPSLLFPFALLRVRSNDARKKKATFIRIA